MNCTNESSFFGKSSPQGVKQRQWILDWMRGNCHEDDKVPEVALERLSWGTPWTCRKPSKWWRMQIGQDTRGIQSITWYNRRHRNLPYEKRVLNKLNIREYKTKTVRPLIKKNLNIYWLKNLKKLLINLSLFTAYIFWQSSFIFSWDI